MKLKLLLLTLITSFSSVTLWAMTPEKSIKIEFYKKGTKNPVRFDDSWIGEIDYCVHTTNTHIGLLFITEKYAGKGFMKPFMLYAALYIFRTNPQVKTLQFFSSAGRSGRLSKEVLDTIYHNIGTTFDGIYFTLHKKNLSHHFLNIPLETNSQIFKNIYVKIINEKTGEQINKETKSKKEIMVKYDHNNNLQFCIDEIGSPVFNITSKL